MTTEAQYSEAAPLLVPPCLNCNKLNNFFEIVLDAGVALCYYKRAELMQHNT